MRSPWVRVGLKSHNWCPYKRQKRTRHRNREESQVKTEAKIVVMHLQAKEHQDYQQPVGHQEKDREQILSWSLQKETTQLTLGFWTSGHQDSERIYFWFFKPPSLW